MASFKKTRRHMAPSAFKDMSAIAGEEATRVLANGGVADVTKADDLLARMDRAQHERVHAVKQLSPVASPTEEPTGGALPTGAIAPLGAPKAPARGIRVDVTGKGMPLTTLLVDKVGQRGQCYGPGREATQLRMAFKHVDADKDGKITMAEMQELLATLNISVSEQSLKRQFMRWTGGKPLLEWEPFVQAILPKDFPTSYNAKMGHVHDIASMARHDKKESQAGRGGLITNLRDWELAFRDKIMSKTRGGPLELRKAWTTFDVDRSGEVTIDEILEVCASWNLYPTKEVKNKLISKYCKEENHSTGVVHYYDFVSSVVASDFKSSADTLKLLKERLEAHWGQLRDQFRAADEDHSGDITLEELQGLFHTLHIPSSAQTTAAIFRTIDGDNSGMINFDEFASALQGLDRGDIAGLGGKLLWEPDRESNKRTMVRRPNTAGSIHSHNGDPEEAPVKVGHTVVDVDTGGRFVVNTAVTHFNAQQRPGRTVEAGQPAGRYPIDLIKLVQNKIYQKYGEKGMYSWLRRACMTGVCSVDRFENLDPIKRPLTKHTEDEAPQSLSLLQWRTMLLDLGLHLTDAAFAACVQKFSQDGTDLVPFVRFTDVMLGKAGSHALNLPSEMAPTGRVVPKPPTAMVAPRSLSPYGVLSHDPVALVRYKIGQLTATRNAANPLTVGARRRLRDQLSTMDPTLSGRITREEFLSVLRFYNIDLKDNDWAAFAAKYAGTIVTADGSVNYKQFQSQVLDPDAADAGFYTPRAGGRLRRPVSPRTVRNLKTPTIKLGQDIPMAKMGWQTTR